MFGSAVAKPSTGSGDRLPADDLVGLDGLDREPQAGRCTPTPTAGWPGPPLRAPAHHPAPRPRPRPTRPATPTWTHAAGGTVRPGPGPAALL